MGKQLKKIQKIQHQLDKIMGNVREILKLSKIEKNRELKEIMLDYSLACSDANIKLIVSLQQVLRNQTQIDIDDTEFRRLMKGFEENGNKR